eukprot:TRINITY_DN13503_c0_g3_i1.p3 TRINITY_DN13503_c0_g3~~TRINITY_DN13503_c0_g3_i1.p3  ORF type:complete len:135 (+),score=4.04 TRINITY_DN13503_c0_g3_i1:144-548(+)
MYEDVTTVLGTRWKKAPLQQKKSFLGVQKIFGFAIKHVVHEYQQQQIQQIFCCQIYIQKLFSSKLLESNWERSGWNSVEILQIRFTSDTYCYFYFDLIGRCQKFTLKVSFLTVITGIFFVVAVVQRQRKFYQLK